MAIYGNMILKPRSGALPTKEGVPAPYVPGSGASARLSSAGADAAFASTQKAAQAQGGVFGALDKAGKALYGAFDTYSQAKAEDLYNRYRIEASDLMNGKDGLMSRRGEAAFSINDDYASTTQAIRDRLLKDVGNGYIRNVFMRKADILDAGNRATCERHRGQQFDAFQDGVAQASMDAAAREATADPSLLPLRAGEVRAALEEVGRRKGWSPKLIDDKFQQWQANTAAGVVNNALVASDFSGASALMGMYGHLLTPEQRAKLHASWSGGLSQLGATYAANGDTAGLESVRGMAASGFGPSNGSGLGGNQSAGMPVINGWSVGSLSEKHESGRQSSRHVSNGLQGSDGAADVGRYSFITGGDARKTGGSVGAFTRWAKDKGGAAKTFYDTVVQVTGGDWSKLDTKSLWTPGGVLRKAWEAFADSGELGALENEYTYNTMYLPAMKRLKDKNPKAYEAIMGDKSGALQNLAFSTIMQHATSVDILSNNYDPDPEKYIEKIGKDRAQSWRYRKAGKPNLGVNRMKEEIPDALYMLRNPGGRAGSGLLPADQAKIDYLLVPTAKANEIWNGTADIDDFSRRKEKVYADVDALPPELAAKVRPMLDQQLRHLESKNKTESANRVFSAVQELRPMYEAGTMSATELNSALLKREGLSDNERAQVAQSILGEPADTPASRAALDDILTRIDSGEVKSAEDVERLAYDGRCTKEQTKTARDYLQDGGKMQAVTHTAVQNAWRSLMNKSAGTKMPDGLFDAVRVLLSDGKKPSQRDLESAIAKACIEGRYFTGSLGSGKREGDGWFNGTTYYEAHKSGRAGSFLPNYDEDAEARAADAIRRSGKNLPESGPVRDVMIREWLFVNEGYKAGR